nr:hypothetical protein [Sedimentibacter sp.]
MYKTIIEEYRELTENIAVIKSCTKSVERDINKLLNSYKPNELNAIDYEKPAVQTSNMQISVFDAYREIHDLMTEKDNLKLELESLYKQRDELEKTINDLGDKEKKALMLRIKGYSNWKIAKEMHYSQRHVERIFKEIREKDKHVGEMSVSNVV